MRICIWWEGSQADVRWQYTCLCSENVRTPVGWAPENLVGRLDAKSRNATGSRGHKVRRTETSDTERHFQRKRRTYHEPRLRRNRVFNPKNPSPAPRNRRIYYSPLTYSSLGAPMSTSDIFDAVKSDEFDFGGTSTMDSMSYCRVCMNDSHRTPKFAQIEDLKVFIRTSSRSFSHWRQRGDGYNSNSSTEDIGIRHKSQCKDRPSQLLQRNRWRPSN